MKKLVYTVLLCGLTMLLSAQIIQVPADQPTIQAGIDVAGDGDTVLVADGNYQENINFLGKAITVASHFLMDGDTTHINNTIIDGSEPDNPDAASAVTFITGEDTTSILCGFTITGGTGMVEPTYGARIGGGIVCYYASAKIIHNKIIENEVSCSTYAWGGGMASIRETGNDWTVIERNVFRNNESLAGTGTATGGGMEIWGNARICNNLIESNHCFCESGSSSGGGVVNESINNPPDTLNFINNVVQFNTISGISGTKGGGIYTDGSYNLFSNNLIQFNCASTGGGNAWAEGGGVFTGNSSNRFYNNIIMADTLTGHEVHGGGICIYYATDIEMTNNSICRNKLNPSTYFWGAGVYCYLPSGTTFIQSNEFNNNYGPLTASSGPGGGLAIIEAEMTEVIVDRNIFHSNTGRFGGGLFTRNSYNLKVTNNIFSNNQTYVGGGLGLVHVGSDKDSGRTMKIIDEQRPVIVNNTFVGNSATFRGGAIQFNCAYNPPVIFNSIFYENAAPTANDIFYFTGTDPIEVSYSDINTANISGPWTGEGNINEDPGFIPGDTLYHLSGTSPCLNMGTDLIEIDGTVYYSPTHDFEGETRPDTCSFIPDIGADEVMYDCVGVEELQAAGFMLQAFPNPAFGISKIIYQIAEIKDQSAVGGRRSAGSEKVCITLHEISGQQVRMLLNEAQLPGEHTLYFDTAGLPAGIYLIRMQAGDAVATQKVVVLR